MDFSTSLCNKRITFEELDKEGFVHCSKKEYIVNVRKAVVRTKVYNFLEDAYYEVLPNETDRIIISGTVGEEWVTRIDKVVSTYINLDGSKLLETQIPSDGSQFSVKTIAGSDNYAIFVPKELEVVINTAWGDVLTANREGVSHSDGDFIMCAGKDGKPDFSDVWVVNGEIFKNTYEFIRKSGGVAKLII